MFVLRLCADCCCCSAGGAAAAAVQAGPAAGLPPAVCTHGAVS